MPLTRKIMVLGKNSYGITLPKSWVKLIEAEHGKIKAVSMEVNEKLVIRPILEKEAKENQH